MAPLAVRSAVVLNHAANLLAESSIHILEPRKRGGSSSSSGSRGSSRGGGSGSGGSGDSDGKKKKITGPVIAGIVIGVVALIILYCVIHIYWRRRNGHKTFADRFLRKKKDTEEVELAAADKVTMKQMVMPEDDPYKQKLVAEHEAKKKEAELGGTWGATDGDARTLRPSTETTH